MTKILAKKAKLCFVGPITGRSGRRKTKPDPKFPRGWKRYIALETRNELGYYSVRAKFTKKFAGFAIHIGSLLVDTGNNNLVDSISISSRLRGFGIGKMLYLRALDDLNFVSTSSESSVFARRAWASIMCERPVMLDWAGGEAVFFKNRHQMRKYMSPDRSAKQACIRRGPVRTRFRWNS